MTKINKEMENYCKTFLTSTISQDKINDYEDQLALFTSNLQDPKLCQDEASELKHDKTKDAGIDKCLNRPPTWQNSS